MWSKLELGYHHNPTWLIFPWEAPIIFSYLIQEIILYGERIEPGDKTSEKRLSLSHWTPEAVCHVLRLPSIDGVRAAMKSLEKSGKVTVADGVGIPGLARYQADPTAGKRKERYAAAQNADQPFQNGDRPFHNAEEQFGTPRNGRVDQKDQKDQKDQRDQREKKEQKEEKKQDLELDRPVADRSTSPSDFDLFWTSYPRKIAKAAAKKAWEKTKKIRPPVDVLIVAIEAQKRSDAWTRDGGQYIPHPATWLNAGRWDDVVEPVDKRATESKEDRAWREQREQAQRWLREAEEREAQHADRKNDGADHRHLLGGVREVQDDRAPSESLADDDGRHTG
jgi:hypothetical protein